MRDLTYSLEVLSLPQEQQEFQSYFISPSSLVLGSRPAQAISPNSFLSFFFLLNAKRTSCEDLPRGGDQESGRGRSNQCLVHWFPENVISSQVALKGYRESKFEITRLAAFAQPPH